VIAVRMGKFTRREALVSGAPAEVHSPQSIDAHVRGSFTYPGHVPVSPPERQRDSTARASRLTPLGHEAEPAGVAEIRSGKGYTDLAGDLVALSALYLESWGGIRDKTAVELHEVERAAVLGPDLLTALGPWTVTFFDNRFPLDASNRCIRSDRPNGLSATSPIRSRLYGSGLLTKS